jgi:hypothetical protein
MLNNNALTQEMIQWTIQTLTSLNHATSSDLYETVLSTPWSYVARFETSAGTIYLKQTPQLLALEPSIIQVLHDQFNIGVADVIAHNNELHCFLMKDAGKTLRVIMKQQFNVELFCKVINNFTSMQLTVADDVSTFLDMGVPDWRLDKLPGLYMQLLSQKEMLIADGLSEKEIMELEKRLPTVSRLCQQLSSYGVKESIVQPDFNDNNTLIADPSHDITIIDLGEIAITHPFFSLLNCLQQAKKHHALTDKDDVYITLENACLKNFTIYGTKKDLQDAFTIADHLRCLYQVLSYNRLMRACDQANLHLFYGHGRLSTPLRQLITVCRQMHKP